MKSLYILLFVWQILRTESVAISSVEKLNLNGLDRYERSTTKNNLTLNTNCNATYKNITPTHTMCLVDVGTAVNLTQTEKDEALAKHNDHRKNVSPKATNMQKMVWDDELAAIATKWAQQCRFEHDAGISRRTISLQDTWVGQNLGAGYDTLNTAIKGWHDEVADFKYGTGSINGKAVGHYTQIVQHMSSRIGCGKASCPDTAYKRFYICNYAIGQGSYSFPYKNGTSSCSDCPNSCQNNLCDCGGKLCYNSGTLDINNCTCTCPDIYVGNQCETLQCKNTEKFWCKSLYTKANCAQYSNAPIDCHMLCGVCPYPCGDKECENGGTLDLNTCKCSCKTPYVGENCTEKNCTGKEKWWCANIDIAGCTKYSNYPSDCNIKCGICPPPCGGKQCKNGGTLDLNTCKCSCKTPYIGENCTEKNCTGKEKSWCANIDIAGCTKYSNYPSDCNIKCGICPPPCNGTKCENGGTLDINTCKCSCDIPYVGETCGQKNCTGKQASWCETSYTAADCTKYSNFPSVCNIMCGVCPRP